MVPGMSVIVAAASQCAPMDQRCSTISRFGPPNVTALSTEGSYTTKIDPKTKWGAWDGWGVSLCWWANIEFGLEESELLADLGFTLKNATLAGRTLPGLGLNIARYNAGGSSYRSIEGGQSMVASPNIPHWKQLGALWEDWASDDPASHSWNWTADAMQVSMLKKTVARGALAELFSNSPVWWMCDNHNPSGSDSGLTDNLESWNHAKHAEYLAEVAHHAAQSWGVTFQSVEAFNEPISPWWKASGTQEGCHFERSTQATVAKLLRHSLDARNLTHLLVAASDENTYDEALATWNSFDTATKATIGQVNTHGYQQGGGRRDLLYTATKGKKLWNSEYGEGDASGKSLASNLNLDFRWLHPTAWVYWQLLDPSGGWGLLKMDADKRQIGVANNKWFILAQYSRHVRRGFTIIDGGEDNTVAAVDTHGGKLVLITSNYGDAHQVTYDLSTFSSVGSGCTRWTTGFDAGSDQYQERRDCAASGGVLKVTLAKASVTTFEVPVVV